MNTMECKFLMKEYFSLLELEQFYNIALYKESSINVTNEILQKN